MQDSKNSPSLVGDKFITTCKEKATLFNDYFLLQCKPIQNSNTLPVFSYITNSTLETVDFDTSSYSVNLFKIVVHCLSSHTLQTLP